MLTLSHTHTHNDSPRPTFPRVTGQINIGELETGCQAGWVMSWAYSLQTHTSQITLTKPVSLTLTLGATDRWTDKKNNQSHCCGAETLREPNNTQTETQATSTASCAPLRSNTLLLIIMRVCVCFDVCVCDWAVATGRPESVTEIKKTHTPPPVCAHKRQTDYMNEQAGGWRQQDFVTL